MSQANIVMGPTPAFKMRGAFFVFTDIDATIDIKSHDTNDSSNADYDQSKPGRRVISISGSGYVQSDVSVAAPPPGSTLLNTEFYPYGLSFAGTKYGFTNGFQVTQCKITAPAKSGDPSMFSFNGHSTGTFTEPIA
jgi:hypothetical protein